ncbi:MAG: threonine synthase, partial [Clostridiales bacterium]|nr:threonine synthase [Clostridiales bacterium]
METLKSMTYQETAYVVMKQFLTDFTEEELKHCIKSAYDEKFDTEEIAPLAKVGDTYHLELFHGATIAFKDMALSILPHLLTTAAKKNHVKNEIVILTATSGDTGKAALAGFADVPGTKIIVFYPKGGVSKVQELQMVTQKGDNTSVVAIHGNFDNAQSGVKEIFEDKELAEELAACGYQFSSANSINIGRLVPQVVYYVYAYAKLLENGEISEGEEINVTVPTGNFGNILAAYYAKRMGLPVAKLICASNKNNVLTDFFDSGRYVTNRMFFKTMSPSMDILISSNLERLLFEVTERNAKYIEELMQTLKNEGQYSMDGSYQRLMAEEFYADFADDVRTMRTIRRIYKNYGYLMDPHTAVAQTVYEDYMTRTGDRKPSITVSTASPFKFVQDVLFAVNGERIEDPFDAAIKLSAVTGIPLPAQIASLKDAPVRFTDCVDKDGLSDVILHML